MSIGTMIGHLLLERLSWSSLARQPETESVMTKTEQVANFVQSGLTGGVLAPIYLYHALQATSVICPGDQVLDMGCGPANQLFLMATLSPQANFVGLDASPPMLEQAQIFLQAQSCINVELRCKDMTLLNDIPSASVDCVVSTMSLHHLTDEAALIRAMTQWRRVLKPGGGVYVADFGRLKRPSTQHYFAHDRQDIQSPQFTADFLQSLQAAFSLVELKNTLGKLHMTLNCHSTALAPFTVIFRSPRRRELDLQCQQQAQRLYASLPKRLQQDFRNYAQWFSLAGLALPFALDHAAID